jgi:hypothetical protein
MAMRIDYGMFGFCKTIGYNHLVNVLIGIAHCGGLVEDNLNIVVDGRKHHFFPQLKQILG